MTHDIPEPCGAAESCTDPECEWHRLDLYSVLLSAAEAFSSSLGSHGYGVPHEARQAFCAVAALAAAEVFGP